MTLDEILKLPLDLENLKVIDLFLKKQNKNEENYVKVILKRLDITFYNDREKETIEEGLKLLNTFESTKYKYLTISKLIEYATYIQREDLFLDFCNIKRALSDFTDLKYLNKDYYKYYLNQKNYKLAKKYIDLYLDSILNEENRSSALLDSIYIARKLNDITYAEYNLKNLIHLNKQSFNINSLTKGKLTYLKLLADRKEYLKAEKLALDLLENEEKTNDEHLEIKTILLKCYLNNNQIRKIENLIPNAEELCNITSKKVKQKFYRTALEFYSSINNKPGINYYTDLLKEDIEETKDIQKRRFRIEVPKKLLNEKKEQEEDLNKIFKKPKIVELIEDKKKFKTNETDEDLVLITKKILEEIKDNLNTRDIIRKTLEYFEKKLNIDTLTLIQKTETNYNLFYYIKGRLYERCGSIENTIVETCYKEHKDLYLAKEELKNYKEPYSLKEYKDLEVICLYLNKYYILHLTSNKLEKYYISTIKLIGLFLSFILELNIREKEKIEKIRIREKLDNILNKGIKIIHNNEIKLDQNLCNILKEKEIVKEDYFSKRILVEDRNIYIKELGDLKKTPYQVKQITYKYKDLTLKETLISDVTYEDYKIISEVEDITEKQEVYNHLNDKLYNSPYGCYTRKKLEEDLRKIELKSSLFIIDLEEYNDFIDLINEDKSYKVKTNIVKILREYNQFKFNRKIYHLENYKFIILINENKDKRTLLAEAKDIIFLLKTKYLNYKIGIVKLESEKELDKEKIINNLRLTLKRAKETNHDIIYYTRQIRNEFIKEKEITNYINEAIENEKINIKYEPITNINDNKIEGYKIIYNIDNDIYKEDEIVEIIKKRGMLEYYLKYKIKKVLLELSDLFKTCKGYLRCYLELPYENYNLSDYLEGLARDMEIPLEALNLIVENYKDYSNLNIYSKNIIDYINNPDVGYILDLDKVNRLKTGIKKDILKLIKKIIAINTKTKEEIDDLKSLGINLIIAKDYKKYYTIEEIKKLILEQKKATN